MLLAQYRYVFFARSTLQYPSITTRHAMEMILVSAAHRQSLRSLHVNSACSTTSSPGLRRAPIRGPVPLRRSLVCNNRLPLLKIADQEFQFAAYSTACLTAANITIPSQFITLQVPSDWDGPYGVSLSTLGTALTVTAGALLGGSALLLFSHI